MSACKTTAASAVPTVSVLLSTYAGETASNLDACLQSLAAQTVPPDEIILVVDGAVGADQERVLAHHASEDRLQMRIVRLPVNGGLATAMNVGLSHCRGDYVARMDSDDLCTPDRLALQLDYARAHPEVDVVCSWSEEFFLDGLPSQIKVSPCEHDEIARALRWRNVLVHPTIFIKAETLRRADGYRATYGRLEDYDLFVRLIVAGARFHVIPKILVRVRSSMAQRTRRGGLAYIGREILFRFECRRLGFISPAQFLVTTILYAVFRLVSGRARLHLYRLARS